MTKIAEGEDQSRGLDPECTHSRQHPEGCLEEGQGW